MLSDEGIPNSNGNKIKTLNAAPRLTLFQSPSIVLRALCSIKHGFTLFSNHGLASTIS